MDWILWIKENDESGHRISFHLYRTKKDALDALDNKAREYLYCYEDDEEFLESISNIIQQSEKFHMKTWERRGHAIYMWLSHLDTEGGTPFAEIDIEDSSFWRSFPEDPSDLYDQE